MSKRTKKILNKHLDTIHLNDQNLSIQLSLDGFSFCIHHNATHEVLALTSYDFDQEHRLGPEALLEEITGIFNTDPLLQLEYSNVTAFHVNNLVSQVPKPFFDKQALASYLNYSIKLLENDYITFDEVENSDIVNVYLPFVNINNFLFDKYGTFTYKHSATVLIEKLLHNFKNEKGDFCVAHVGKNTFELIVISDSRLQLYNHFQFSSKEDFIYYILFTAEQLKMNPETFKLLLTGSIEKSSELYHICYQYIRNIDFLSPAHIPELLKSAVSSHDYYALLNA